MSIEFFQAVVLSANEWTLESVLATAAQIQRKRIAQRYAAGILVRYCLVLANRGAFSINSLLTPNNLVLQQSLAVCRSFLALFWLSNSKHRLFPMHFPSCQE